MLIIILLSNVEFKSLTCHASRVTYNKTTTKEFITMPDATQLRHDSEKLRQKARDKRMEAEKITLRASNFSQSGEFERAEAENKLANREREDAEQMERTAMDYDQKASDIEASELEQ